LLCDNLAPKGEELMQKHALVAGLAFAFTIAAVAAAKKSDAKTSGPAPDRALLQKLLDGWNTMDPANVAQYYDQGAHMFFDMAPLKYNSWDEYANGVKKLLADYKTFKLSLNDDADVHQHGDVAWSTATLKEEATLKNGKREMANMRWTVVWQRQNGKWLIVHEHTSEPLQ
jgi:ketosteroid isomerase-like protein